MQIATEVHIDAICDAFAQIVDAKSSFTGEHSARVCAYSVEIGQALGIAGARLTLLRRAALLHDVGKLAVSNAILDKPGRPTEDEWAAIKKHPYYTQQVLGQIRGFERLAEVACAHHERLDGRGYFRGLTADATRPGHAHPRRRRRVRRPLGRAPVPRVRCRRRKSLPSGQGRRHGPGRGLH